MKLKERYLAVYSDSARKKLDRVPSFVQGIKGEFISMHEERLFNSPEADAMELTMNPSFDAPTVLGFDAVFSSLPGCIQGNEVELTDKDGTKHKTGLGGQVGREGSSYYNRGLINSEENLSKLWSAMKRYDNSEAIKSAQKYHESIENRIFPVTAIGGMTDTMWMAMTMRDFAYHYRKQTKLYYDTIKYFSEMTMANVEGVVDAVGKRPGIINILDDVAFKGNPMVSPARWETDFGKYYKDIIKVIRDAGMVAQLHTDGDITELIPVFKRIGFQGVQGWEGGMDPFTVNEKFPDFVVVGFGDVGEVLPFGTAEQIDAHVKKLMDALKVNRHYVCGPSTVVVKEMPYENVITFTNAIKKYGKY